MKEEWKPITEYEGLYEVSNTGKVKSIRKSIIMSPHEINSGYMSVTLTKDERRKNKLVHRLVAREFCEGYKEELDVNHKDTDRKNNKSSNLEWMTRLENLQDMRERGMMDTHTARKALSKVSKKAVDVYDFKTGEFVGNYDSATTAAKALGVSSAKISAVCHGKRPHTGGYVFRFAEGVDINRSKTKK